jgi:hypothetical protein
MLPTERQNPTGLHQRYIIRRANGKPIDPNAIYFVLRLDDGGKDPAHIKASRKAARAYAKVIEHHLPDLASELRGLVDGLEGR